MFTDMYKATQPALYKKSKMPVIQETMSPVNVMWSPEPHYWE